MKTSKKPQKVTSGKRLTGVSQLKVGDWFTVTGSNLLFPGRKYYVRAEGYVILYIDGLTGYQGRINRICLDGVSIKRATPSDTVFPVCKRSDGYDFFIIKGKSGYCIRAGCRRFYSLDEAKAHWLAANYWKPSLAAENKKILQKVEDTLVKLKLIPAQDDNIKAIGKLGTLDIKPGDWVKGKGDLAVVVSFSGGFARWCTIVYPNESGKFTYWPSDTVTLYKERPKGIKLAWGGMRDNTYAFYAHRVDGKLTISCGCHTFDSFKALKKYYYSRNYPGGGARADNRKLIRKLEAESRKIGLIRK